MLRDETLRKDQRGRDHVYDERRALVMLAEAGLLGQPEALMIERGFAPALLAALIRDRLAVDVCAWVRAGTKIMPITNVRITDAGRRLLAGT
jgi:hypothetical protein